MKSIAEKVLAAVVMLLVGAVWLLYIGGGLALTGIFLYGIYALFAKSIALGLMLIGASVVGGWLIQFLFGLLMATTMAAGAGVVALVEAVGRWKNRES